MLFEDSYTPWDDAENKARAAFELYEEGELYEAIKLIDEAIQLNPENSDWHFNKALALDALGNFVEAIEEYKVALEIEGDDLEILNALAVDYTRNGEYDLSLRTFEKIQAIDPDFEPCYCNRIITYTEMDQHNKAEEVFYLAQQIEPDCPICFYNIGNSLFSRGDFKKAVWCWTRTSEIDPNHPQINYRIAQGYWAMDKLQIARKFFLEELRNNPGQIEVILDFGVLSLEMGDFEGAREKFHRILELNSCYAPALFYLGEAALIEGNREKAKEYYVQAVQVDNYMVGPRYRLGQFALEEGDEVAAKSFLKSELDLEIEDSQVFLSIGSMMLKLGMLDYASHCFLQVSDREPKNIKAYQYLAMTLLAMEQLDDAAQFIEYALSLNESDPSVNADAAMIYQRKGDLESASECINKSLSIKPDDNQYKLLAKTISSKSHERKSKKFEAK